MCCLSCTWFESSFCYILLLCSAGLCEVHGRGCPQRGAKRPDEEVGTWEEGVQNGKGSAKTVKPCLVVQVPPESFLSCRISSISSLRGHLARAEGRLLTLGLDRRRTGPEGAWLVVWRPTQQHLPVHIRCCWRSRSLFCKSTGPNSVATSFAVMTPVVKISQVIFSVIPSSAVRIGGSCILHTSW